MYNVKGVLEKHHFIPKCKGGKDTELVHAICHRKIHSLFNETQCAREYSDPDLVKAHPEMQKFISWISKRDPLFNDHHKDHKERKRKRRY
jgi:hypothetical protein